MRCKGWFFGRRRFDTYEVVEEEAVVSTRLA
jgi:hypothetical protein